MCWVRGFFVSLLVLIVIGIVLICILVLMS